MPARAASATDAAQIETMRAPQCPGGALQPPAEITGVPPVRKSHDEEKRVARRYCAEPAAGNADIGFPLCIKRPLQSHRNRRSRC
jgi:hypothetical protein